MKFEVKNETGLTLMFKDTMIDTGTVEVIEVESHEVKALIRSAEGVTGLSISELA